MKALLHYRASPSFRQHLAAVTPDWLRIVVVGEWDKSGFAAEIRDTDVLLHVLEPVTSEMITMAPKLRLIQKIGVGVNTIDTDAASRRGIAVCNMPGTNSQAVSELALGLMLSALRRIPLLDREMRAGRGWQLPPSTFDLSGEISGRTVGLIGFGQVPRRLAPVLQALGAQVIYTDKLPAADNASGWRPLDDLLAVSDIISLHLPLTAATSKLINAGSIARMKRGVVIVNTARGGLIDEDALVAALRAGHVMAAGLDVVADEPAAAGNPIFELNNVVVTPHAAWLTTETLVRSLSIAVENCKRLGQGSAFLHPVVVS